MDKSGKLLLLDDTDFKDGVVLNDELNVSKLKQKSFKEITTADIAIVSLKNGKTILLKNRSGITGVVVPENSYDEFLKWLDENKPANTPSKKSFFGRFFERNS